MAIREIIVLPDKQLRLVSKPIEKVTPEIRKLADDMLETMYDAPGIGLAGIQIAQGAVRDRVRKEQAIPAFATATQALREQLDSGLRRNDGTSALQG